MWQITNIIIWILACFGCRLSLYHYIHRYYHALRLLVTLLLHLSVNAIAFVALGTSVPGIHVLIVSKKGHQSYNADY